MEDHVYNNVIRTLRWHGRAVWPDQSSSDVLVLDEPGLSGPVDVCVTVYFVSILVYTLDVMGVL
jgi:hypothetical protein